MLDWNLEEAEVDTAKAIGLGAMNNTSLCKKEST
jgi:hypothetical protein